jgi:hypothetical protein
VSRLCARSFNSEGANRKCHKKLTPEIIKAAILGFEAQQWSIDEQIAELRATLAGDRAEPAKRKRRKISAAGRARWPKRSERGGLNPGSS